MKKDKDTPNEARRGFIRLASLGAVASGVAVVAAGSKAEAAVPVQDASHTGGYRQSEHVNKVYELARF